MKNRTIFLGIITIALLATPLATQAATETCPGAFLPPCVCTDGLPQANAKACGLTDFIDMFVNLYAFGLHIAAPLAVFYGIIGGTVLLTAAGYQNRITMGKTIITQAVTGLVVVLMSWVIIDTTIFVITGNRNLTITGKPWFSGIATYVCEDTELRQGCSGENVKSLQTDLARLGYSLEINGNFDPTTRDKVLAFQSDMTNRVYKMQARQACNGSDPAVVVWERAFDKPVGDCNPGGNCAVLPNEITVRAPELSGVVDGKTQTSIQKMNLASQEFSNNCRTQS